MFERVLAPVDFSQDARAAARLAWCLTHERGVLEILHVDQVPELDALASSSSSIARRAWHALRAQHQQAFGVELEKLVSDIAAAAGTRKGPRMQAHVRTGEVVETILQEARAENSELIVIGAHGESGSLRFMFGSVAAKVSRQAPCPVLVSRPGKAEEIARNGRFHRVLVAIDHSPFARHAVRYAHRALFGAGHITLLHVWRPPPGIPLQFTGERRNYEADRMQNLVESLALDGSRVESLVDVGQPAAQILAHAESAGADLVVVGSHGREGIVENVVGTTADRVLRHADIPVLLVPEQVLSPDEREDARLGRS